MKQRLDVRVFKDGLVASRSQAESYIKLGKVKVNGVTETKPGFLVAEEATVTIADEEQYVSRAALKLKSVASILGVSFKDKTVLDVGSSTGGFTQFVLKQGAKKVFAVEIGTNQLHPSLLTEPRIELHEKTDIRDFKTEEAIDVVVADVSFISLREILPSISRLCDQQTKLVLMVKPQFEAAASNVKHKGVIKNDRMRRQILHEWELWTQHGFRIIAKADSEVAGAKGNRERFYLLNVLPQTAR